VGNVYVERWEGNERWPDVELLTHLTQKRLHFLSFTVAQDRTHWILLWLHGLIAALLT
jgi:hypothetical protein